MPRRVPVLAAVLLLLVAVVAAGVLAWRAASRTDYATAVSLLPAETLRASWTDWAAVRRLADGKDADSTRKVEAVLGRAFDQDLVSASALSDSAAAMRRHFGLSPLDASWEMVGQSREGVVTLLSVPESVDLEAFESRLAELGYDEPAGGAGSGEVWRGGVDLAAQIDVDFTPVLQHVAVLPDERVVVFSDTAGYVSSSVDVVTGAAASLTGETEGVTALADLAEEPVSAVLYASDFACEAMSMAQAGDDDQALAERLVDDAGDVNPLAGLVLARQQGGTLLAAMHFETADQAGQDVRSRLRLAQGEAPGQGGTFADRFAVAEARQDGQEVVLDLRPVDDQQALLSDLTDSPVLFAAC